MSMRQATAISVALTIVAIGLTGHAQTITPEYSRKSDVIYGRKVGLALTMELLTPAHRNGLGVVWVVSSSGK